MLLINLAIVRPWGALRIKTKTSWQDLSPSCFDRRTRISFHLKFFVQRSKMSVKNLGLILSVSRNIFTEPPPPLCILFLGISNAEFFKHSLFAFIIRRSLEFEIIIKKIPSLIVNTSKSSFLQIELESN